MRTLLLIALAASSALAQSGETPVYIEQLKNLQASMERMYQEVSKAPVTAQERMDLRERLFALVKTTHRLQEQAGDTNSNLIRQSAKPDKRLMLIGQGCLSIESVLVALDNYLATDDRLFLSFAVDFRKTVESILKTL